MRPRLRTLAILSLAMVAALAAVYQLRPTLLHAPLVALNRWSAGLEERVVTVDGHEVHYLAGGDGAETVVLLHGIFAEKDHWVDFARRLTPRYRVVALDVPGFGASTRLADASYDYPAQARRLHLIADALGLERFHLAGSSMGGAIATVYAVEHPGAVLSLAYIGAPHGVRSPRPTPVYLAIEAGAAPLVTATRAEFDAMLDLVFAQRPFLPKPIVEVAARRATRDPASDRRLWAESWRHGLLTERLLPRVAAPTFALWGAEDRLFDPSGADVLLRGLWRAQVVVAEGVGHLPMLERPEESATAYVRFLERI
jgi:pimeloyl-ACP methyl ester carboxylesterase